MASEGNIGDNRTVSTILKRPQECDVCRDTAAGNLLPVHVPAEI